MGCNSRNFLAKLKPQFFMKKLLFIFLFNLFLFSCGSDKPNPCNVIFDFVKQDLNYPEESSHHRFDSRSELNTDGSYTVFTFVTAKNVFGMRKKHIYKYVLDYNGSNQYDLSSWTVISKKNEEVK